MGKGKKKRKGGGGGGGGGEGSGDGQAARLGAAAFVADLTNNIAGQAIGQLVADGLQRKAPTLFGGPDKGPDIAARLLLVLAEQGPRSVAQLLEQTDAPVQTLLDAIAAARRAKLITRIDKAGMIRGTESGCAVARVVREKIEREGRVSDEESTAKGAG
jgi:hypothetical protein